MPKRFGGEQRDELTDHLHHSCAVFTPRANASMLYQMDSVE